MINRVAEWWLGTMQGPDHLYPNCPHLARVKKWTDGDDWPRKGASLVDPARDPYGDLCGWCVRVWRARNRTEA